jgi:hypothetical protein
MACSLLGSSPTRISHSPKTIAGVGVSGGASLLPLLAGVVGMGAVIATARDLARTTVLSMTRPPSSTSSASNSPERRPRERRVLAVTLPVMAPDSVT